MNIPSSGSAPGKSLFRRRLEQIQASIVDIDRQLSGGPGRGAPPVKKLVEEKNKLMLQLKELEAHHAREQRGDEPPSAPSTPLQLPLSSFLQDSLYKSILSFKPGASSSPGGEGAEASEGDPVDERATIESILEEMGLDVSVDPQGKEILLHGADIFLDNLIANACAIARNRGGDELSKDDVLFSMWMETKANLYNKSWTFKKSDPDKEHLKKLQMIKKDCKRGK